MDLQDRLNWQQACTFLGCSKSMLFKMVREGVIPAYGAGARYRWYSRKELTAHLKEQADKQKDA